MSVSFEIEKHLLHDLRRKYETHKRYQNPQALKQRKSPWKPTFTYQRYERFDDLLSDGLDKMQPLVEKSLRDHKLTDKKVAVFVNQSSKMGQMGRYSACYNLKNSDENNIILHLGSDLVFGEPFLIDEQKNEEHMGRYKNYVMDALRLCLREHIDRKFKKYTGCLIDIVEKQHPVKQAPHITPYIEDTYAFLCSYILGTRACGFPKFDGDYSPLEGLDFHDLIRSFALFEKDGKAENQLVNEGYFLNRLKGHTHDVVKVFEFLNGKEYFNSTDIYYRQNPLKLKKGFNSSIQGKEMINVIGFAELMDTMKEKDEYKGRDSLFQEICMPHEIIKSVDAKLLDLKSIREFYDLFYSSADKLALPEDTIIIPKRFAAPFLECEEKLKHDYISEMVKNMI